MDSVKPCSACIRKNVDATDLTFNRKQSISMTYATKSDGKVTRVVNVANLIA
jgi:hypothetical protein